MALLNILEYPDPRLRTRATEVKRVSPAITTLVDDMLETMYAAPGIGLAATQVNVHRRVIVVDTSEEGNNPCVLINPEFESLGGEQTGSEGCLSVPGFYEDVTRIERIRVTAMDRDGTQRSFEAEGLLSQCIQHECDHLEGKIFVDYLSAAKRQRIRKRATRDRRNRA